MQKSTHSAEYQHLRAELRAMRESAALSQRDVAAKLKISHSWVAKVETGERRIDVIEFCWFAAACGADPVAALGRVVTAAKRPKRRRMK